MQGYPTGGDREPGINLKKHTISKGHFFVKHPVLISISVSASL